VLLYLRHGPEKKDVRRFPGCLIVFTSDKAVYSVAFLGRQENRTPLGLSLARQGEALGRNPQVAVDR
jgi:hypothetical protein